MKNNINKTKNDILKLQIQIHEFTFPLDLSKIWNKYDVVILKDDKSINISINKRVLITPYACEVSWIIEKLFQSFRNNNLLTKECYKEFLGRLVNAGNWYIRCYKKSEIDQLLFIIIEESKIILNEMSNNDFRFLPATFGNIILDDIRVKLKKPKLSS